MQKANIKKILALTLAFIVTLYILVTYVSMGNFDLFSFGKTTSLLFSQSESKTFDSEYIKSNQNIVVSEPNGVGAVSHDYSLFLENIPKKIVSISIQFDDQKTSTGDISLRILENNKTESFGISNTGIRGYTSLHKIGVSSAEEIEIYSRYDAYGGSQIVNPEIVSISSIKINDTADILALKKQLVLDIITGTLVSVGIWLIVYFIIKSRCDQKLFKNKFNCEKVFFFTAIISGFIFAFLMPIYQVPDELTHLLLIYEELNWDIDINAIGDFADTARITRNFDQKVNLLTYFNMNTISQLPSRFTLPSVLVLRHLPQAIGVVLTSLLRLPLWAVLSVSEIFAVLSYAIFGYWTIKIIPIKKELMTAILLLPICLQEFPSLSYDSFLLSTYFLFFAYVLYVKFSKDKFTLLDLAIMLSLVFVIAVTKIPYALVVVLILTIPISKIDFNFYLFRLTGDFIKKHKWLFLSAALLCVIAAIIFGIKVLPKISYGKILIATFLNIKASSKLILNTIIQYSSGWLIQITGDLGWFDTPVALIFSVFVIANLLFFSLFDFHNKGHKPLEKNPFNKFDIVIMVIVFFGMSIITILSMFTWTLAANGIDSEIISVADISKYIIDIPLIGGIQGRYFLPILPLLLVPWYFPKISKSIQGINHVTYLCGYHLTVFIYIAVVLLNRYWI